MSHEFLHEPCSWIDGLPCFLKSIPPDKYNDPPDLQIYLKRYRERSRRRQIYQSLFLDRLPSGANVLSVAEGTGEVVVSLAEKYRHLRFYAFDLTANRVKIAAHLANHAGVDNVTFYVGSAEYVPFEDDFFRGVIERGIFHTLPLEVKRKNLAEIERTCRGTVVMDWVTRSARWCLLRQWWRSVLLRDPQTWRDYAATYRNIDKRYNTLKKLARLIESETGHAVKTLRSFAGDRELEEDRPSWFAFIEPLGGLVYATDD